MTRAISAGALLAASLAGSSLAGSGAFDSAARAQESDVPAYFSDQYEAPLGPPVVVPPAGQLYLPPAEGPAVFGWEAVRPLSCGEYRYWNGVECLDARDDPPYVGPRW